MKKTNLKRSVSEVNEEWTLTLEKLEKKAGEMDAYRRWWFCVRWLLLWSTLALILGVGYFCQASFVVGIRLAWEIGSGTSGGVAK